MNHPGRPKISDRDRAAIDKASDERAAEAPPLADWQIAGLIRITRRPRRRRNARRESAA